MFNYSFLSSHKWKVASLLIVLSLGGLLFSILRPSRSKPLKDRGKPTRTSEERSTYTSKNPLDTRQKPTVPIVDNTNKNVSSLNENEDKTLEEKFLFIFPNDYTWLPTSKEHLANFWYGTNLVGKFAIVGLFAFAFSWLIMLPLDARCNRDSYASACKSELAYFGKKEESERLTRGYFLWYYTHPFTSTLVYPFHYRVRAHYGHNFHFALKVAGYRHLGDEVFTLTGFLTSVVYNRCFTCTDTNNNPICYQSAEGEDFYYLDMTKFLEGKLALESYNFSGQAKPKIVLEGGKFFSLSNSGKETIENIKMYMRQYISDNGGYISDRIVIIGRYGGRYVGDYFYCIGALNSDTHLYYLDRDELEYQRTAVFESSLRPPKGGQFYCILGRDKEGRVNKEQIIHSTVEDRLAFIEIGSDSDDNISVNSSHESTTNLGQGMPSLSTPSKDISKVPDIVVTSGKHNGRHVGDYFYSVRDLNNNHHYYYLDRTKLKQERIAVFESLLQPPSGGQFYCIIGRDKETWVAKKQILYGKIEDRLVFIKKVTNYDDDNEFKEESNDNDDEKSKYEYVIEESAEGVPLSDKNSNDLSQPSQVENKDKQPSSPSVKNESKELSDLQKILQSAKTSFKERKRYDVGFYSEEDNQWHFLNMHKFNTDKEPMELESKDDSGVKVSGIFASLIAIGHPILVKNINTFRERHTKNFPSKDYGRGDHLNEGKNKSRYVNDIFYTSDSKRERYYLDMITFKAAGLIIFDCSKDKMLNMPPNGQYYKITTKDKAAPISNIQEVSNNIKEKTGLYLEEEIQAKK